jgi:chemotaxis protein CheC
MMTLTLEQEDALIEIGNIGMSKAARQLSNLLNTPIKITIPDISYMNITEMTKNRQFDHGKIYSFVSQTLSNDLDGAAALVFRREHANLLMMAVVGVMPEFTQEEARACEQEAMLEIGNIIITSCVSVIANMLSKSIAPGLPVYNEDKIGSLLTDICLPISKTSQNFIAITTMLDTRTDQLSGHLFIVLTDKSAGILLNSLEELLDGRNTSQ